MDEYKLCFEIRKVEPIGSVERLHVVDDRKGSQEQLLALGLTQRVGNLFHLSERIGMKWRLEILEILNFLCPLDIQETVCWQLETCT